MEKAKMNHDFFKTWTPAMAWALGIVASDGCVYISKTGQKTLILRMKDLDIIERVREALQSTHVIPLRRRSVNGKTYEFYDLTITSATLVDDLISLGVTPRKSLTLAMPPVPDEYLSHFMRGVFEGDGCFDLYARKRRSKKQFRARITTGSFRFAEEARQRAKQVGVNLSLCVAKSGWELMGYRPFAQWMFADAGYWKGGRRLSRCLELLARNGTTL